jgi:hypothetical protein
MHCNKHDSQEKEACNKGTFFLKRSILYIVLQYLQLSCTLQFKLTATVEACIVTRASLANKRPARKEHCFKKILERVYTVYCPVIFAIERHSPVQIDSNR